MSTYGHSALSSNDSFFLIALVVLGVIVLIADLAAVNLFTDVAIDKGHFKGGVPTSLWLIGIFATPITVGLYVLMLPDLSKKDAAKQEQKKIES